MSDKTCCACTNREMEVLKSGDAPALVSNLELMQLLRDRAAARRPDTAANNTFEHRDWIEVGEHEVAGFLQPLHFLM